MALSLSILAAALAALTVAYLFAPLGDERRRALKAAMTASVIVASTGMGLMLAAFLAATVYGKDSLALHPLMAAIALPLVSGIGAFAFGSMAAAWPNVFEKANDRFAASLYLLIGTVVLILCTVKFAVLRQDWPGYAIALLAIPLIPVLANRRLKRLRIEPAVETETRDAAAAPRRANAFGSGPVKRATAPAPVPAVAAAQKSLVSLGAIAAGTAKAAQKKVQAVRAAVPIAVPPAARRQEPVPAPVAEAVRMPDAERTYRRPEPVRHTVERVRPSLPLKHAVRTAPVRIERQAPRPAEPAPAQRRDASPRRPAPAPRQAPVASSPHPHAAQAGRLSEEPRVVRPARRAADIVSATVAGPMRAETRRPVPVPPKAATKLPPLRAPLRETLKPAVPSAANEPRVPAFVTSQERLDRIAGNRPSHEAQIAAIRKAFPEPEPEPAKPLKWITRINGELVTQTEAEIGFGFVDERRRAEG